MKMVNYEITDNRVLSAMIYVREFCIFCGIRTVEVSTLNVLNRSSRWTIQSRTKFASQETLIINKQILWINETLKLVMRTSAERM